jgi:hypothetical protein
MDVKRYSASEIEQLTKKHIKSIKIPKNELEIAAQAWNNAKVPHHESEQA